ncbi:hypothetical protein [Streptomyces yanii]|uniref:hypothetical protein n=1 Tax=Streptomyces yanii TaxID=78510 RepID=UPI0031E4FC30
MAHLHPRTARRRRATRSHTLFTALAAGVLALTGLVVVGQTPQVTTARQAEALDRGVVSVHTDTGGSDGGAPAPARCRTVRSSFGCARRPPAGGGGQDQACTSSRSAAHRTQSPVTLALADSS